VTNQSFLEEPKHLKKVWQTMFSVGGVSWTRAFEEKGIMPIKI